MICVTQGEPGAIETVTWSDGFTFNTAFGNVVWILETPFTLHVYDGNGPAPEDDSAKLTFSPCRQTFASVLINDTVGVGEIDTYHSCDEPLLQFANTEAVDDVLFQTTVTYGALIGLEPCRIPPPVMVHVTDPEHEVK